MRFLLPWTLGLLVATSVSADDLTLTHGVASGDITSTSAVLWARSSTAGVLTFEIDTDPGFAEPRRLKASSTAENDFIAQVTADRLKPGTTYHYRVSVSAEAADAEAGSRTDAGSLTTAPIASEARPVRFIVGGDVGGQGYCRHPEYGYRIFSSMAALKPDFFVANGDMIYADNTCPANGPGGWSNIPGDFPAVNDASVDWQDRPQVSEVFLAHWRYNRADAHQQEFLRRVPIYAQWDDHEVVNDFGGAWSSLPQQPTRAGYPTLVATGREAFFAWNPIRRHPEEPERIYRSFRWGQDVELFVLDARSYRSLNESPEHPNDPKALLGDAQLEWLLEGLTRSDATWKVVSSDVPLSVPTGSDADLYGRDAFADGDYPWGPMGFAARTGFEAELTRLLTTLDARNVRNVIFVATDVHFALSLRYHLDVDGDGDRLLFHELLSGPMNAARAPIPPRLDPTFRPVTLYAEAGIFNFSYVRVERRGDDVILTADIRDTDGEVRFGSHLELVAE